jgi:hypothetical protein
MSAEQIDMIVRDYISPELYFYESSPNEQKKDALDSTAESESSKISKVFPITSEFELESTQSHSSTPSRRFFYPR